MYKIQIFFNCKNWNIGQGKWIYLFVIEMIIHLLIPNSLLSRNIVFFFSISIQSFPFVVLDYHLPNAFDLMKFAVQIENSIS